MDAFTRRESRKLTIRQASIDGLGRTVLQTVRTVCKTVLRPAANSTPERRESFMSRRLLTPAVLFVALAAAAPSTAKPPDLPIIPNDTLMPETPATNLEMIFDAPNAEAVARLRRGIPPTSPFLCGPGSYRTYWAPGLALFSPQGEAPRTVDPWPSAALESILHPRRQLVWNTESGLEWVDSSPPVFVRPAARRTLATCALFGVNPALFWSPIQERIDDLEDEENFGDLLSQVTEDSTGGLLISVGVNSEAGFSGSIVLKERNCDQPSQPVEPSPSPMGTLEYAPPDVVLPLPLYSTQPEVGRVNFAVRPFTIYVPGKPAVPVKTPELIREMPEEIPQHFGCDLGNAGGVITGLAPGGALTSNLDIPIRQSSVRLAPEPIAVMPEEIKDDGDRPAAKDEYGNRSGCIPDCSSWSEDLRQIEEEWDRVWFKNAPEHLTPEYVDRNIEGKREESHLGVPIRIEIHESISNDPPPTPEENERDIERKLQTPVTVSWSDTPLRQVLQDLRAWEGVNIYVDKPALEDAKIDLDHPIDVKLEQVSLKSVLKLVLKQARLTYFVEDEVIQITTERGRGHEKCCLFATAARSPCGACAPKAPEPAVDLSLQKPVSLHFENVPLRLVLDDLRNSKAVPLCIDKPALDAAEINLEEPLTVQLDDVSLHSALLVVLHPARLTYVVTGDVIQITTEQAARGRLQRATYEIGDILDGAHLQTGAPVGVRDPAVAADLLKSIVAAVHPASWKEAGGPGAIDYCAAPCRRCLIVEQTAEVQRKITAYLDAMRAHLAEARRGECEEEEASVCCPPCGRCEAIHRARQEKRAADGDATATEPCLPPAHPDLVFVLESAAGGPKASLVLIEEEEETPAPPAKAVAKPFRAADGVVPACGKGGSPDDDDDVFGELLRSMTGGHGVVEFGVGMDGSVRVFTQVQREGAVWHFEWGNDGGATLWASPTAAVADGPKDK
jgi:hypothetical protein